MKRVIKLKTPLRSANFILGGLFIFGSLLVSGNIQKLVFAASLSQGYHSSKTLTVGTVVSVKQNGSEVEPTSLTNESRLGGVVIVSTDTVVDLQPNGSDVRIGTSGQVTILVSTVNGDIKEGDNLVISPISGVATKDTLDTTAKKYVAIASESFTEKSQSAKKIKIALNDGGSKDVAVGSIRAKLNMIDRPSDANTKKQNYIVALVSRIIGKEVNRSQLIASTVVFVTAFFIAGFLMYGSIKGSFISLGRNPLSKSLIVSNLFKIIALGLLILEIGGTAAYIILVL